MAQAANVLAGLSFPFRNFGQGIPDQAFGTDVIRSALIVLLRTKKRSRVMNPDIGTNLHYYLFEDVGPFTEALIFQEITSAVANQLPQVTVIDIQFQDINEEIQVNLVYNVQGVTDQTGFISVGS